MPLTPFAEILAAAVLTGGLMAGQSPETPAERRYGWTEERAVQGGDTAKGPHSQRAFVLREDLIPDSSPGKGNHTLYERDAKSGDLKKLAERVEGAVKSPQGRLFFVQDENLFALEDDGLPRKIADRCTADLVFSHRGDIAVVSLGEQNDPAAIDLISADAEQRTAARKRLLDLGSDNVWLPLFTPDGRAVIYLSGESGFASFWRLDLDGKSPRRQLTNQNVRADTGGVFSQDFVPPADRRENLRFISDTVLEYTAGNTLWHLNVVTGHADRVSAAQPAPPKGGQ